MSVIANELRAERRPSQTLADLVSSPAFFWAVVALYLAVHVMLRLWETPNLAKNDVQEAVSAQVWAWGYHPRNPPLHTWLLMASYSVFGVTLLAHVILKYLLLGTTFAFAFLAGRRLLSSPQLAILSALALTTLSPFAWTVHTALTHTLLLAAANLAVLWAAVRLTETQRLTDYALFGAALALGFLAKYSFALFLLPLIAAMLTQTSLRRALLHPRMLLSLGVALVLFAPHGLWMLEARFDFVQFLAEKQHSEAAHPYLVDVALGFGNVAVSALSFLAPFLFLFPAVFWRSFGAKASPASPWAAATALTIAFSLGLLLLDIFVLRATLFEQRYMMCALLLAPLVVFQWLDRRDPSGNSLATFAYGLVAVSILAGGALAGRALLEHRTCNRCWEELPFDAVVRDIRAAGFVDGTIVADHYNVAGNMRLAFPNSRIVAANYFVEQPPFEGEGQCLLVWNARNAGDALPAALADYLAWRALTPPPSAPHYVEAPLRRSRERIDRFAYLVLPDADAACRPR